MNIYRYSELAVPLSGDSIKRSNSSFVCYNCRERETIAARPDSICHGFRSSGPDTDRDKVAFSLFKLLKYTNLIRT